MHMVQVWVFTLNMRLGKEGVAQPRRDSAWAVSWSRPSDLKEAEGCTGAQLAWGPGACVLCRQVWNVCVRPLRSLWPSNKHFALCWFHTEKSKDPSFCYAGIRSNGNLPNLRKTGPR